MNNKTTYKILFLVVNIIFIFSCTERGNKSKPNVIVILSYDQGWGDLSIIGEYKFEVELYYTCPAEDIGSTFRLSFCNSNLTGKISEAQNLPLTGMRHDRFPRIESYVKDFKRKPVGTIHIEKRGRIFNLKNTGDIWFAGDGLSLSDVKKNLTLKFKAKIFLGIKYTEDLVYTYT